MTFQAARFDFKEVFEVARAARGKDPAFLDIAENAKAMIDRLDALTSYLNNVASARAARELRPVSLAQTVKEFERGMRQLAQRAEIELTVEYPPLDGLYTRPMHEAELASILLNFYSNSVKAVRNSTEKRRIDVEAVREGEEIVLRFSDTGDGISAENREKVFEQFFTTRAAAPATPSAIDDAVGTGLGLWIVHEIVTRARGTVKVVDPPEGFTTRMEVRLPAEEEA
jgi:signal transduction histidine kinase